MHAYCRGPFRSLSLGQGGHSCDDLSGKSMGQDIELQALTNHRRPYTTTQRTSLSLSLEQLSYIYSWTHNEYVRHSLTSKRGSRQFGR
jgi:hypothetical protein